MYVCPAHICIDKSHITDEAKLACKCEPQDLPISTSPALGLLVCSTMLFLKVDSGVNLRSPSLHGRWFSDWTTSPDSQLCNDAKVIGLQKSMYLEFRSVLVQTSTMQCWTLVMLCSNEPHSSWSAMWLPTHSIMCCGTEAWHLVG